MKNDLRCFLGALKINTSCLFSVPSHHDHFTNSSEVVSSDFVGSRHAGVADSLATIVQGNCCVLYVRYGNEFGYSCQVVRMVQKMVGWNCLPYPTDRSFVAVDHEKRAPWRAPFLP